MKAKKSNNPIILASWLSGSFRELGCHILHQKNLIISPIMFPSESSNGEPTCSSYGTQHLAVKIIIMY